MTKKLRDDEFEGLLGRALRMEPAPASLEQRLLGQGILGRGLQQVTRSSWLVAFISPARIAASAALLSLLMGFAMGWGNASLADEQDGEIAAVLYAANDVGDF